MKEKNITRSFDSLSLLTSIFGYAQISFNHLDCPGWNATCRTSYGDVGPRRNPQEKMSGIMSMYVSIDVGSVEFLVYFVASICCVVSVGG